MPIYMDRHDSEDATARAIEDAHQKDLKLQEKYGIRLLTYWFDEQRQSTFCLVDSPSKEKVRQLHAEAHGSIPHKIVEVNPQAVEAFLGRIEDPQPASGFQSSSNESQVDSAFRTIMFTDMKDSTAITTQMGDINALELFRTHNAISRDAIRAHKGREIQHTGDGFMVSFTSASGAVECAITLQTSFALHNEQHPDASINIRIGICAGEPVEEDNRLFGSAVQLSRRICDYAAPDQVLVAPVIRDLCLGKRFVFTEKGQQIFKGFDQPQPIYELDWR